MNIPLTTEDVAEFTLTSGEKILVWLDEAGALGSTGNFSISVSGYRSPILIIPRTESSAKITTRRSLELEERAVQNILQERLVVQNILQERLVRGSKE